MGNIQTEWLCVMSQENGHIPQGQPSTESGADTSLSLPSGGTYELKKLRDIHHIILRLAATGMQQKEIASQLGVTEATVNYTVNCDLGQQKLAVLRGQADFAVIDVLEEFENIAPLAVEVLENIMLSPAEKASNRIRAAENILGGAGYGKRERIDVYQHGVSDADIEEAKKKALEKGRSAGIVVDHQVEDAKVISEDE